MTRTTLRRRPMVEGILLLSHQFLETIQQTTRDHIEAFSLHSRLPVITVNTDAGWVRALGRYRFRVIVLHYSLFGGDYYHLRPGYLRYLARNPESYKIAFFHDEMRYCGKRFAFLNRHSIDAVYSCLQEGHHETVYGCHTSVRSVRTTLPGFISDDLVAFADRNTLPEGERVIDIGYRGSRLPFWMGRGTQEKYTIAGRFIERARGSGLVLDIDPEDSQRFRGHAWYEFLAKCRGVLGVESGASIFDLDDTARERTESLLAAEPGLTFDEVERRVLHEYEDNVPYRFVSPRVFEAAALKVTQILYRGQYSGVLRPDEHYLALEKDFSNFDDVLARFADPAERQRVAERAYEDLVASGRYSYARFIEQFDQDVESMLGEESTHSIARMTRRIHRNEARRRARKYRLAGLRSTQFPGRQRLKAFLRSRP